MRPIGILVTTVAVLGVVLGASGWRESLIVAAPMLPVAFDHADHVSVNCIDCHHNYVDDTGSDLCYACHKHHADIAADTQRMFHDFCRGCHLELALEHEDGGPLRRCVDCHHRPAPADAGSSLASTSPPNRR